MANLQSAKKRMRQNLKRRERNRRFRNAARTYVKRCRALIAAGQLDEAEEMAQRAASTLDKAARRRVIHPNNAARRKSRLMSQLQEAKQASELA